MNRFDVPTISSEVLERSHLIEELQTVAGEHDEFRALLGPHVAPFHDVSGGYHSTENKHVVSLIHEPQGDGAPFRGDVYQSSVELHFDTESWQLDVTDVREFAEAYPDSPYQLTLFAEDYRRSPHSFLNALLEDVDKRETRYE